MRKTTNDQRLYKVNGEWKAEIDLCDSDEDINDPSIKECRHAVLHIHTPPTEDTSPGFIHNPDGYVVYDRLLSRIVNGVYGSLDGALVAARRYNRDPESAQDMAPNGRALSLIYPDPPAENPDNDGDNEYD